MHSDGNSQAINSNSASGEAVSQNRCPVCRYSLRGLPVAHRCPECGLEYDEHTRLWRPKFGTPFRGVFAVMVFVNLAIAVIQIGFIQHSRSLKIFFAISILIFLAMPYLVWRMRPFVAVTPKGILTRWLWRTQSTEWSRVEYAGDFEANIKLKNLEYGFVEFSQFLPDKNAQAAFRRAVNEALVRYNNTPDSESQTTSTTDTIKSAATPNES